MADPKTGGSTDDNRAVGYIRVSSAEQAEHGFSQDVDQPREIEAICARDRLDLVRTFTEKPQSAKTNDRPEFRAMMDFCVKHGIRHIAARMWERLSRSEDPLEYGDFLSTLKRHRIQVHLSKDTLDVATASGDMLRALIEQWFASEDNSKRSEKAFGAWRTRRGQHRYLAGRPPHGYDYVRKHRREDGTVVVGRYEIAGHEAPAVRHVFARFLEGAGSNTIAKELLANGWRRRNGQPFNPGDIREFLDKPIYAGYLLDKGSWIRVVNVEPIITFAEWRACQDVRTSRRQPEGRSLMSLGNSVFGGLVVCGHCGGPMLLYSCSSTLQGGERRKYVYYRCKAYYLGGPDACPNSTYTPNLLVAEVMEPVIAAVAVEWSAERSRAFSTTELSDLEVQKANLERRLIEYSRQRAEGEIPQVVYAANVGPAKKEYDQVLEQIALASGPPVVPIHDVSELLAEDDAVRMVLAAKVDSIVALGHEIVDIRLKESTRVRVAKYSFGQWVVINPWLVETAPDGRRVIVDTERSPSVAR